jgi:hypothetical protein
MNETPEPCYIGRQPVTDNPKPHVSNSLSNDRQSLNSMIQAGTVNDITEVDDVMSYRRSLSGRGMFGSIEAVGDDMHLAVRFEAAAIGKQEPYRAHKISATDTESFSRSSVPGPQAIGDQTWLVITILIHAALAFAQALQNPSREAAPGTKPHAHLPGALSRQGCGDDCRGYEQ